MIYSDNIDILESLLNIPGIYIPKKLMNDMLRKKEAVENVKKKF